MDFLSKCLFNLHAIGGVPKGQKINTRGDYLSIERDSYLQWVKRFSDGRTKVFRDINRYVSTAIEISTRIMESKYFVNDHLYAYENNNNVQKGIDHSALRIRSERILELGKIRLALEEARRGVVGQQETYKDDTDIQALTTDLIKRIDDHIGDIKIFLRGIGEKIDE